MFTVTILRGASGSGKSTRAKEIVAENPPPVIRRRKGKTIYGQSPVVVCSADDFFTLPNGAYMFDPKRLPDAHSTCREKFTAAVKDDKVKHIVLDNTNILVEHITPYIEILESCGRDFVLAIETVHVPPDKVDFCAERCAHGVPSKVILRQIKAFEELPPTLKHLESVRELDDSMKK